MPAPGLFAVAIRCTAIQHTSRCVLRCGSLGISCLISYSQAQVAHCIFFQPIVGHMAIVVSTVLGLPRKSAFFMRCVASRCVRI